MTHNNLSLYQLSINIHIAHYAKRKRKTTIDNVLQKSMSWLKLNVSNAKCAMVQTVRFCNTHINHFVEMTTCHLTAKTT